jgi:DNA polymerase-3 subunit delta'
MSTRGSGEDPANGPGPEADSNSGAGLPWLDEPRRRILATQRAHALLIHGPGNVGQFDLASAVAQGWLCESAQLAPADRPCGRCASCRLVAARSHPDLLVLVPEALRESLGWEQGGGEGEEGGEGASAKRKPSKDIRVEAVRAAIVFATTTSARGRGKVVVIHPAERMNDVAASAFLKTLEEPAGPTRFLLCSAAPDRVLPTIRSRCQHIALAVPPARLAEAWLAAQDVQQPAVLLAASGGQPQEALERAAQGLDAETWLALPGRIARGDASALQGWPLPLAVETLQKVCHDALCLACGGAPRYFPSDRVAPGAEPLALLRWSRELARVALEAEHPWSADLAIESLVEQGRQALKTPRSERREGKALSLNSPR